MAVQLYVIASMLGTVPELPSRTLRIVVADDHPSIRENLRYLLNAELGLVVVGVAKDGRDALRLVHATRPDVLVVDSDMRDLTGIEVAQTLREDGSRVGIILYTLDSEAFAEAKAIGIDACITKDSPPSMLIDSIRSVAHGVSAPPAQ
jgi:two-component system, NarL family, nitrate/nitrite response regulator NarL